MTDPTPQPETERLPFLRDGALVVPRRPRAETKAEAIARGKTRKRRYAPPFVEPSLCPTTDSRSRGLVQRINNSVDQSDA